MGNKAFNAENFFTNMVKIYNEFVLGNIILNTLKMPEKTIMYSTFIIGFLVLIAALLVLYRSCYLKEKSMHLFLTSLIIIGILSGVSTVWTLNSNHYM